MKSENTLLFIALVSDILYPLLNWKLGLPEQFRWVSQAAIMILIIIGLFRSLRLRNFPFIWLILLGWLFFSAVQALTTGQSLGATVWGFYTWLRYPLLGLYAYTRPKRFFEYNRYLSSIVLFLVSLNLLIQVAQFVGGEIPGDNLAGFWGIKGTGRMASFICLALAISFGYWIVKGSSRNLWIIIGMSILSSVLGELKVFPLFLIAMGILAILLYTQRRKRILSGILLIVVLIISSLAFIRLYDLILQPFVPIMSYLDPNKLIAYLSWSNQGIGVESYIGRLAQIDYIWKLINQDPFTLLFGQGIGSLEISQSLGSSGITLLTGALGAFGATSSSALVGDFGMVGVIVMLSLLIRTMLRLVSIRGDQDQEALNLGLVIFIFTLPLWMFYMDIWVTPITMLILWFGIGQSLRYVGKRSDSLERSDTPISFRIQGDLKI